MISLSPLADHHRTALRAVKVAPEQVVFSGQPDEVIDLNADEIDIHVILSDGRPVGMFRIDRGYHAHHTFASSVTPGLRTFLIDAAAQGRGHAKAACALLPEYLSAQYPRAEAVFLTVNLVNPVARAVYLAGGFFDTGAQFMTGAAGPQHILKLPLRAASRDVNL